MKGTLKGYRFTIYCLMKAIRHPRTSISYHYCNSCHLRFSSELKACPQCGDKVNKSPENKQESPIPWYGSLLIILVGTAIWGWSAACHITEISELGRVLVYIPLGNLFGLSLKK